jgi:hypothetical protein
MIHILGIRHHGPGSAKNVKSFLEETKPDIVLVEGPQEADAILQWVGHKELKPPVAILCYQPDNLKNSVFYPFAEFSPEWQAIIYAREHKIPVKFMDLPTSNRLAIDKEECIPADEDEKKANEVNSVEEEAASEVEIIEQEQTLFEVKKDPISYLAEAAGYNEGEKWWEHTFEHRHQSEQVFDAVTEAMQALRQELKLKESRIDLLREAYMRKMIRQAEREMFQNIAVVCGAWHAPSLSNMPKQKEDNELLKSLPKVKVECTWIPWTYSRLSYFSGYGAGIHSPGWYEHIWRFPTDDGSMWMAKIAQLLRKNGMDTSVAHVIEAVRLAESLASMRNLSKAGLEELNEATVSVIGNGDVMLLQLVSEELIVSNKLGEVPAEIPKPPLQVDIEKMQKRLRLPPTADYKDYVLDLRKENDLERSIFLHRLHLLGIKWGEPYDVSGKGTFKEQWRLQWDPGLSVDIIEKGVWGNTVEEAANNYVIHHAQSEPSLQTVATLLQRALPSELHKAVEVLIQQLNNLAAASGDVVQLMEVVPSLVNVSRYGNVRKTDSELVVNITTNMLARIFVGMPNAVTAIDEDTAKHLLEVIFKLNDSISILQKAEMTAQWQQTLRKITGNKNAAPVIDGYATRLLKDQQVLEGEELINAFSYNMSLSVVPEITAAWLEGFLRGSGTLLLVDEDLWGVVNNWVAQLDQEIFRQVLPLLRRTFSTFTQAERRKIGEKVKLGSTVSPLRKSADGEIDRERAREGIPVIMQLLGLTPGPSPLCGEGCPN